MAEQSRSLRRRFAVVFGLLFVSGAIGLRVLHYYETAALLARELDIELWAQLTETRAWEMVAPGSLGGHERESADRSGPAMPAPITAWITGTGLAGLPALEWFAGVWRPDGTLVESRALPADLAWDRGWTAHQDTPWTTADGRYRLAATTGRGETLLVVGTPLADLVAARSRAALFQATTFIIWVPLLLGIAWFLLGRVLAPLRAITATARRIHSGRFEERLDLDQADAEYVAVAETLNLMLDRLDAIRSSQARFNADVAHQLVNPAHGILLEAEVATSCQRSAAELNAALGRIGGLAHRIESLCDTLLTYSRTAAIDPARLFPVDLEPILESAADQLGPAAAKRGVTIRLPEAGTAVLGDPELLREAFGNLLANAIEHSPAGSAIEVTILAAAADVRVSVIDHGQGVAEKDRARLFERFYSDKPGGGHGVGLALCRTILRSHGGDIGYRPTAGGGATFEARIPAG